MSSLAQLLGPAHGGRVLDVATGRGGFVTSLLAALPDHDEIVGIDVVDHAADFAATFPDLPVVRFELADAAALPYADATFDLAAVANSLHHFVDPVPVLAEMLRVLRPGGRLVIAEMLRDGQRPEQMTHVKLHHWWAAVDTTEGVVHRETYRRQAIVQLVAGLGLDDLRIEHLEEEGEDPHDSDTLAELDGVIDRYLARAAGHPPLVARGHALRRRLHRIGIRSATTLVAIGRKPGGPPAEG